MAAAKKCDNCGALYDQVLNKKIEYNAIRFGKVDPYMNWNSCKHLDLCPGCLNAVTSALEKSKNIANELRKENEQ